MVEYRWKWGLDAAHVDVLKAQWMWKVTHNPTPISHYSLLLV